MYSSKNVTITSIGRHLSLIVSTGRNGFIGLKRGPIEGAVAVTFPLEVHWAFLRAFRTAITEI
jgi:hypothetical protein